jgi:acyl-CoA reductase-like NAD-dependent aldehyde dehydrogenase
MTEPIRKTYKLYIGGEFVRSESGRYDLAHGTGAKKPLLGNICRGSRKDLRDAVRKAREAQPGWASKTAYLKGQILYRMAEMLEGRAAAFEKILRDEGSTAASARAEVRAAIDRLVHYAGWTDKFPALTSTVNPVASSYFNFSAPEPMGVVGIVLPETPSLLGVVTHVAPVLASGNVAVVLLSESRPISGLELGEVFATSDLPPAVVNLISGRRDELVPHLARHMDVNAIADAGCPEALATELQRDAAVNVKRVRVYRDVPAAAAGSPAKAQGLHRITDFTELKTTWHPMGW